MKPLSLILAFTCCFLVAGCFSSVKIPDDARTYIYNGEKYGRVELTISKNATEDTNDLVRFHEEELLDMIQRKLEVSHLIDVKSPSVVKIEITDVRVRSSFNAFMWGAMAGNDHIRGDISLVEGNGIPRHTFHVSASYALGGFAGFNETRMGWLYEEFSKLTLEEILGEQGPAT